MFLLGFFYMFLQIPATMLEMFFNGIFQSNNELIIQYG